MEYKALCKQFEEMVESYKKKMEQALVKRQDTNSPEEEAMATQNIRDRERVHSSNHLRTKGEVSAQHAKRQTTSSVTSVSAVVQVTILHEDVAGVQPAYHIRETEGGYHRETGSS
ncbi:hypothetical protein ACROYT_G031377 [Oculina patagonica]